jgi:hypothetical protein
MKVNLDDRFPMGWLSGTGTVQMFTPCCVMGSNWTALKLPVVNTC